MEILEPDPFISAVNDILGSHGLDAAERVKTEHLEGAAAGAVLRASWIASLREVLAFVQAELDRAEGKN